MSADPLPQDFKEEVCSDYLSEVEMRLPLRKLLQLGRDILE